MKEAVRSALLSCRAKSRHLSLLIGFTLSISIAEAESAGPVIRDTRAEQLSANDIADLRILAAQILPAKTAIDVIELSTGRPEIVGEPFEQTAKLWRGFYFRCHQQDKRDRNQYHGPIAGSWIAEGSRPMTYAVVAPPGKTLPPFSNEAAGQFNPILIEWIVKSDNTVIDQIMKSDDIVGVCDAISISPPIVEKTE